MTRDPIPGIRNPQHEIQPIQDFLKVMLYETRRFLAQHSVEHCCDIVSVVVQFYPWFKFYFLLFLGMVMNVDEFETKENNI